MRHLVLGLALVSSLCWVGSAEARPWRRANRQYVTYYTVPTYVVVESAPAADGRRSYSSGYNAEGATTVNAPVAVSTPAIVTTTSTQSFSRGSVDQFEAGRLRVKGIR